MTKKHFQAMADELKGELAANRGNTEAENAVKRCASRMAGVCYQFNNRFDRLTFLMACGLDADEAADI